MTSNKGDGIYFLTVEDVIRLHQDGIDRGGGNPGIKDQFYLESAVMQPQQRMYGQYLHSGVEEMAAAYMFHICQNHAFQDANKRTALLAAETFLQMNGRELSLSNEEAFGLTTLVASGQLNKQQLTDIFSGNTQNQAVEKTQTYQGATTEHHNVTAPDQVQTGMSTEQEMSRGRTR